jgi:hypothetical protein
MKKLRLGLLCQGLLYYEGAKKINDAWSGNSVGFVGRKEGVGC